MLAICEYMDQESCEAYYPEADLENPWHAENYDAEAAEACIEALKAIDECPETLPWLAGQPCAYVWGNGCQGDCAC
ncbi:MAG: hypothetical protein EP330_13895 [Deltaproteobacteria bacterium]|nr:MAG: hypothetical protein EP330_13895 [Deltaproteobacteria bacterium]